MNTPKKIAIIGLPGSGKSTFACKLGERLNLPVHHLDKHLFQNDVKRDHDEFISIQQEIINSNSWILEGCSIKTLEMRFSTADTVIYLQFPRLLCVWRVFKRACSSDSQISSNSGCATFVNWELLKYIWTFESEKNERIEELKKQYPHVKFHALRHPRELDAFLKSL